MKILTLSDLHFEFWEGRLKQALNDLFSANGFDVMVIAGDFLNFEMLGQHQRMNALLRILDRGYPVVYVPGNHEYYGCSDPERVHYLLSKIENGFGNFHWLRAGEPPVFIKGRRFIGDTMWFRERDPYTTLYAGEMNDFHMIGNFIPWVYEQNRRAVGHLEMLTQEGDIVVTHHLPSNASTPEEYKTSNLNVFYICDMEDLIIDRRPALWVHGHTHSSSDYMIGQTRVVCNPFGYVGYETNDDFDPFKIVEV